MLKGFFANINMKAKNKVKGSQVVVELNDWSYHSSPIFSVSDMLSTFIIQEIF